MILTRPKYWLVACAAVTGAAAAPAPAAADLGAGEERAGGERAGEALGEYLAALEGAGLIDVAEGSRDGLARAIERAEDLLRAGDPVAAAARLYGIVESPAFEIFEDLVEYRNAEYTLAVALASTGAYGSALDYFARAIERGPDSMYYAPAHREAVDIALEIKAYDEVLSRIEDAAGDAAPSALVRGERAYLRGRRHYDEGDLAAAEAALADVGPESRLRAAALYLRGIIHVREGRLERAAGSLCEVADTPAEDVITFAVDDRYFELRDLARLGLGRVAHEVGDYDDAYYHYFQIPQDSGRLGEALFEAAWSMYQERELPTARWLVDEFTETFPVSPLRPEAELLSGYIDLASCEFEGAEATFEALLSELDPVAEELADLEADSDARRALFSRAITRFRAERGEGPAAAGEPARREPADVRDQALALLQLDDEFLRVHDAMMGLRGAAASAPHATQMWRRLARDSADPDVAAIADEPTLAEAERARADRLARDARRLSEEAERARAELERARRAELVEEDDARAEAERLAALEAEIAELRARAEEAARAADAEVARAAPSPELGPLFSADIAEARRLERESEELLAELEGAADAVAARAVADLREQIDTILDRAELGRIDTVIGQKRELEIEVQDLAAGRFPPELHGKMWEEGLIGEHEEYWPFEGEYWPDEYEGSR